MTFLSVALLGTFPGRVLAGGVSVSAPAWAPDAGRRVSENSGLRPASGVAGCAPQDQPSRGQQEGAWPAGAGSAEGEPPHITGVQGVPGGNETTGVQGALQPRPDPEKLRGALDSPAEHLDLQRLALSPCQRCPVGGLHPAPSWEPSGSSGARAEAGYWLEGSKPESHFLSSRM